MPSDSGRKQRSGIRVHRCASLTREMVTRKRFHRGQQAFEDDRDLALRILDYEVVHLTYRQLTTKPAYCMAIVKKALNNV